MKKDPLFYAKILLFGEYGIIKDSMGLSIPYNFYKGAFVFDNPTSKKSVESNHHLAKYLDHLKAQAASGEALAEIDLKAFEADINKGLHFDSSIPQGFGVGSSGALVAAIYDKYAVKKIDSEMDISKENIVRLKAIFSQMESYFHGKSSGIDPLICYLNLPLLIKSKEELGTVALPQESKAGEGAIFLLNSGQPGETQPMVNIFMERMKQEGFRSMLKNQFIKYNDACIQAFLKGDIKPLFKNLKHLSAIALENFTPMIPNGFVHLWEKGIESEAYYLKLCGSGGGGYILGFTRDLEEAKKHLEGHNPEVIYRF